MKRSIGEGKGLIEKLLTDSLSIEERAELNSYQAIDQTIQKQWEETPDLYTDKLKEQRMLTNVMRQIRKGSTGHFRQNLHRYAWVASVALLLICGTLSVTLLSQYNNPEVWYVLNSGRQSMDSVRLADGTFIMLNAGSRLTYPKEFYGEKREITLSGQAFFNVHPDKEHPFVVKTKGMDVTALGTAFEVFSYDGDEKVETVLLSGRVRVEPKDNKENVQGEYILSPNEKLSYSESGSIRIENVDANLYSSWRTGEGLSFKNEKLGIIIQRLEKWYGQKIDCSKKMSEHYRFTFTVRNESLDLILNIMSHNAALQYKLINNDYYVLKELR